MYRNVCIQNGHIPDDSNQSTYYSTGTINTVILIVCHNKISVYSNKFVQNVMYRTLTKFENKDITLQNTASKLANRNIPNINPPQR